MSRLYWRIYDEDGEGHGGFPSRQSGPCGGRLEDVRFLEATEYDV